MTYPLFYSAAAHTAGVVITLDENHSKHAVQVLRLQRGDRICLTDGQGHGCTAIITDDHRKRCSVMLESATLHARQGPVVTLAISPVKNMNRFEWLLEKAAELGVARIVPLLCARTEKMQLREERLRGILLSALLQSQQYWLTELAAPVRLQDFNWTAYAPGSRFIAHCIGDQPKTPLGLALQHAARERLILIGPEGDFTEAEVEAALQQGCTAVSLGPTRLRTETAGMLAAGLARLV